MIDSNKNPSVKTPWHLWLFGLCALAWSSMGAYDYLMTQTNNHAYLSSFTPEQLKFFHDFPVWLDAAWAISVWGGVVGALLLLMRKRAAVTIFLASMLCVVITTFRNYAFADGAEIMASGFSAWIFPSVIFAISMSLFLYAQSMRSKGVLT